MKRRDFLQTAAATMTLPFASALPANEGQDNKPHVMTVLGEIRRLVATWKRDSRSPVTPAMARPPGSKSTY